MSQSRNRLDNDLKLFGILDHLQNHLVGRNGWILLVSIVLLLEVEEVVGCQCPFTLHTFNVYTTYLQS